MKHLPPSWSLNGTFVLLALIGGFFVVYPITDADIFWHLASGRELLAHKRFLFTDPFAFTPTNAQWINLHWLFQLIMIAGYRAGGYLLLLLIKWAAVSGAIALLLSSFPKTRRTLAIAALLTLTIYFQRYLVPLRPIILTLVYIGIFIACYERYIKSGRLRWSLLLIITQIAWVNSQGLYLVGPAIGAVYAFGEFLNVALYRVNKLPFRYTQHIQKNAYFFLMVLPAILLGVSWCNPYGADVFAFAGRLFNRIAPSATNIYSRAIPENMPLLPMMGTMYAHYSFIIGTGAVLVVATALSSLRTIRFSLLGLAGVGFGLAFMAQRNGILFTFLAFPALFYQATFLRLPKMPRLVFSRTLALVVIITAPCAALVKHSVMLSRWPHLLSPFCHPVASAAYLKKYPQQGNIFNADRHGGYLLFTLYPGIKVSSDTRLTLRSDDYFREYLSLINNPASFNAYAARWNIKTVILPLAPVPYYHTLAHYLYRHPTWSMVFTDGAEVLFIANTSSTQNSLSLNSIPTIDSLVTSLRLRYGTSLSVANEALLHLAAWCIATESYLGAERVLAGGDTWQHRIMFASVRQRQGDLKGAEALLLAEHALHPRNNHITMSLIYFYLNTGHKEKALPLLSQVLDKNPLYPPARTLLFTLTNEKRPTP